MAGKFDAEPVSEPDILRPDRRINLENTGVVRKGIHFGLLSLDAVRSRDSRRAEQCNCC